MEEKITKPVENCKRCGKRLEILKTKIGAKVFEFADAQDGYCPKCWPTVEQKQKEEAEKIRQQNLNLELARQRMETEKRLIAMLGGPVPFENYRMEKFKPQWNERAFVAVKNFDLHSNLFLYGACGSGKTHLAVARMIELAMLGVDVYYFRTPTLMRRVRGREAEEEQAVIDEVAAYPMLVWDDAGVGRGTEFMIQIVYEIIEKRWANGLNGLIVTSNLYFDALAAQINDDRLTSRLMGMCRTVNCGEKDRRGQS